MKKRDFTTHRSFPGTDNNDFDIVLHVLNAVERMPMIVFAVLLFLIAWVAALLRWQLALELWLFMIGDWILLGLLPRFHKSYGPPQPPVLALAIMRAPFILLPPVVWIPLEVIGTLLVVYGFWIEPHRLTVTYQTLRSPKLKAGAPIRILHLGDLHIERVTDRERKLIELVKSLKPDLILFSGDFLNLSYLRDPKAWEACRWVLPQITAPLGVYAVSGSPAVDLDGLVPKLLEGMPWRWLNDEKVTIEQNGQTVEVVGMVCTHKPFLDEPTLIGLLGIGDQQIAPPLPLGSTSSPSEEPDTRLEKFTILLYHTPDLAPNAAELGVDMQLSGHTHGGQVRLPFYGALFAASLYGKAFESGRRQLEGLTLYVTRGIGMEGAGAPRVRFLCPPEIILWEVDGV